MRAAQVGHGADPIERDVLDPTLHLLHAAAAHVADDVGLAVELFAQVEVLVGAKVVVLGDTAPVRVEHGGSLVFRADPVHPVVLIRKATPWPAQDGNSDLAQRRDDIAANPTHIGDGRVLANPDAAIDAAAEMFGKMPIDVAADGLLSQIGVDDDAVHVFPPLNRQPSSSMAIKFRAGI